MEFLKRIKKFSLATIAVSAVAGLLFLIFPAQCIKYISLALGISLIAIGIIAVVGYFTDRSSAFSLALGIIVLITGIVVCAKYKAIISLIVVIFGIFILITGLVDFATSIKAIITLGISGWFTLALSVLTSVFGIIAITKSAELTETIVQFIGASLLIYAVLDLISFFQVKSIANRIKQAAESNSEIETDATIVDDDE